MRDPSRDGKRWEHESVQKCKHPLTNNRTRTSQPPCQKTQQRQIVNLRKRLERRMQAKHLGRWFAHRAGANKSPVAVHGNPPSAANAILTATPIVVCHSPPQEFTITVEQFKKSSLWSSRLEGYCSALQYNSQS